MNTKTKCPHCGAEVASLESMSWAEIKKNPERVVVGDSKVVDLITGERVEFVVVGKEHDKTIDGGMASLTFATKHLLEQMHFMNPTNTNKGGWGESFMRKANMERIYRLLPDEVKDVICTVIKHTGDEKTNDKLFLFSEIEVFGTDKTSREHQYPYFKDEDVREMVTVSGNDYWWWLRSPLVGGATGFRDVYAGGGLDWDSATGAGGVCLGFCV